MLSQFTHSRKNYFETTQDTFRMGLIQNDYYSADEVAKLKEASIKSVYRWVKAGLLPAENFRGMLWIEKKVAHAFHKPKRGRRK